MPHGWDDVLNLIATRYEKCREPARQVKIAAADVRTHCSLGYYYHPDRDELAIYGPYASNADRSLCKSAAVRAVGADHLRPTFLSFPEVKTGDWVKLAYSPAVRRAGELLNFFPGTYPGGIPNAPSPLASMLTTALVGGGLGYGLGAAGEYLMPRKTGGRLKRTGLVAGALLGAMPGAAWAYANNANGHSITDGWPLNSETNPSNTVPDPSPHATHGNRLDLGLTTPGKGGYKPQIDIQIPDPTDQYPELKTQGLSPLYKASVEAFVKQAFGGWDSTLGDYHDKPEPTPYDVNINHLGQLLWDGGASPQLAGTTMGTLYAAQQLPDPRSQPGIVTAGQLGQLALNAGKNYLTGALVGAALNTLVGTPFSDGQYGGAAAALGVVKTVVPKLFS